MAFRPGRPPDPRYDDPRPVISPAVSALLPPPSSADASSHLLLQPAPVRKPSPEPPSSSPRPNIWPIRTARPRPHPARPAARPVLWPALLILRTRRSPPDIDPEA
ncbi:hypothetical protein K488DRAFT_87247 [Vararia minispora EC-137]|uniref:Uncharacterized protein n=1 Tax=Vararia minispora EC-137 TaxID=1314806 RepID=A0ACB8QI57_9AGAM|nr:hypothetical protein K488DRAFT_87247 [Vararia minispora EC-137]